MLVTPSTTKALNFRMTDPAGRTDHPRHPHTGSEPYTVMRHIHESALITMTGDEVRRLR